MAPKLIYAADDEYNIRVIIKSFLENEGYTVETFETGDALLDAFEKKPADLIILDIMMPGSDGFSVCAKLRQKSSVPIIILSAKDKEIDYVTGIAIGSDDYFIKPFSPVTLVMRVRAMFRRIEMENTPKPNSTSACFGDITLNHLQKAALKNGTDLGLTVSEFNLLAYLVEQKERAISRDELLNRLWGFESEIGTRAADDTVKRIRRKLTAVNSNVIIETVWGFGFRLKIEVT